MGDKELTAEEKVAVSKAKRMQRCSDKLDRAIQFAKVGAAVLDERKDSEESERVNTAVALLREVRDGLTAA